MTLQMPRDGAGLGRAAPKGVPDLHTLGRHGATEGSSYFL